MSDNKENKGWDIFTILFLIFLTLKLGNWGIVATWSWWWVFSPIWLPIAIAFVALGIIAFIERL